MSSGEFAPEARRGAPRSAAGGSGGGSGTGSGTGSGSTLKRLLAGLWVPLLVVIIWQILDSIRIYPAYFFPSPKEVVVALWTLTRDGTMFINLGASIARQAIGFLIGCALAIPLGLSMGASPRVRAALWPMLRAIYPIPGIAWVPLAILWFGIGNGAGLFAIAVTCFFPMLFTTLTGVISLDPTYFTVMKVFGTNQSLGFRRVVIPGTMPFILAGLRLSYGVGWRTIISAEMISSITGIGFLIDSARWQMRSDILVSGMVVIAIVGVLTENLIFDWIEARTVGRWTK